MDLDLCVMVSRISYVWLFVVCIFCCFFFCCLFFFQAEDGIRDLVRSRGLGDVYKRQGDRLGAGRTVGRAGEIAPQVISAPLGLNAGHGRKPVSYTHLTLPTSDLV